MHGLLAMRAFTRAFHWKIVGKHFSMTYFLCFYPQAQISIQFETVVCEMLIAHIHIFEFFWNESLIPT